MKVLALVPADVVLLNEVMAELQIAYEVRFGSLSVFARTFKNVISIFGAVIISPKAHGDPEEVERNILSICHECRKSNIQVVLILTKNELEKISTKILESAKTIILEGSPIIICTQILEAIKG